MDLSTQKDRRALRGFALGSQLGRRRAAGFESRATDGPDWGLRLFLLGGVLLLAVLAYVQIVVLQPK